MRHFPNIFYKKVWNKIWICITHVIINFQSLSAFSMGASKLSGKVAEVGWRFTEVASQKVTEVSGAVSEKVIFH